jgi:hypothetical protein
MVCEKMNIGREMKYLLSYMNLAISLHSYYQKVVEVFPKSECPQGWWKFQEHDFSLD